MRFGSAIEDARVRTRRILRGRQFARRRYPIEEVLEMGIRFLIQGGLVQRIGEASSERASDQHFSPIELFSEPLNDEPRLSPFVIALPESRRTSPFKPID